VRCPCDHARTEAFDQNDLLLQTDAIIFAMPDILFTKNKMFFLVFLC